MKRNNRGAVQANKQTNKQNTIESKQERATKVYISSSKKPPQMEHNRYTPTRRRVSAGRFSVFFTNENVTHTHILAAEHTAKGGNTGKYL